MLQKKHILLAFVALWPRLSSSQENSNYDLLIQSTDSGSYATKFEHLVNASDVIVRGRYGRTARQGRDYGGKTVEDIMRRTGRPREEASLYGIPFAEHEIIIDEILKGNEILLDAQALIVWMAESDDALEVFEWLEEFREGEHLFFLRYHPDKNWYSIRGNMFDMKKMGESYFYRDSEKGEFVSIFGSENADNFLEAIQEVR